MGNHAYADLSIRENGELMKIRGVIWPNILSLRHKIKAAITLILKNEIHHIKSE
jgi:hypothetical protein